MSINLPLLLNASSSKLSFDVKECLLFQMDINKSKSFLQLINYFIRFLLSLFLLIFNILLRIAIKANSFLKNDLYASFFSEFASKIINKILSKHRNKNINTNRTNRTSIKHLVRIKLLLLLFMVSFPRFSTLNGSRT